MKSRVDAVTALVYGHLSGDPAPSDRAPTLSPRLLDVHSAASYLSVTAWTISDWVADGHLVPVDLPPLRPREGDRRKLRLRRLLFDRARLDEFVDRLKGAAAEAEVDHNLITCDGNGRPCSRRETEARRLAEPPPTGAKDEHRVRTAIVRVARNVIRLERSWRRRART